MILTRLHVDRLHHVVTQNLLCIIWCGKVKKISRSYFFSKIKDPSNYWSDRQWLNDAILQVLAWQEKKQPLHLVKPPHVYIFYKLM